MFPIRHFYRKEPGVDWPDSQGHATETRTITFAYAYNQETGVVQYGASVHRDCDPSVPFVRASHRNTAIARLLKRPVTIRVPPHSRYSSVEEAIRDAMRDHGVRGERLATPLQVETVEKWVGLSKSRTGVHRFIVG